MTTGQYPKRRESDRAAQRRAERMAEKIADGTYRQPTSPAPLPLDERPNADLTGRIKAKPAAHALDGRSAPRAQ